MTRFFILLIAIAISSIAFSQERVQFTIHLKNGDVVTGYTDIREVQFRTPYGPLTFPISEVNSLTVGIKRSSNREEVILLLDDINFGSKETANIAFEKLSNMGEGVVPLIKDYKKDIKSRPTDKDASITIDKVYEIMLAKFQLPGNFSTNDVIKFKNNYAIDGNYEFTTFPLNSKYGDFAFKRSDIKRIDVNFVDDITSKFKSYIVKANEHISGKDNGGWLNTGILVKAGQRLRLLSNGEVKIASLSGNAFTPDGGVNGAPGPIDNNVNYGQLVYKIGDNGEMKKAGNDLDANINETGVLYLSIFETVFNGANNGQYIARVRVD